MSQVRKQGSQGDQTEQKLAVESKIRKLDFKNVLERLSDHLDGEFGLHCLFLKSQRVNALGRCLVLAIPFLSIGINLSHSDTSELILSPFHGYFMGLGVRKIQIHASY